MIFFDDLRQLAGASLLFGNGRPILSGVSTDSRSCGPGDLFVALRGERFDAHDFIPQVLSRGTKAFIVSTLGFEKHRRLLQDACVVVVPDTMTALSQLARLHRSRFSIPILAVAGSNGKTGTKDLLAHVLSTRFKVLKTEGNLNNHIGVPLTLLRLRPEHTFAVLEIGTNHFGEVRSLCDIARPTHGLVTSIGREHLEFFGNLDGVARAEFELYDWLGEHRGFMFAPAGDPYVTRYFKANSRKTRGLLAWYRLNSPGPVSRKAKASPSRKHGVSQTACDGVRTGFKTGFHPVLKLSIPGEKPFQTKLGSLGRGGELASVAASAVAAHFNVPVKRLARALSSFKAVSGKRMQISAHGGVTLINDAYNSNPDSLTLGLETLLDYPCRGKRHLVLADMLELGNAAVAEHAKAGALVSRMGFDSLFTFGPMCRHLHENAATVAFRKHFDEKEALARELMANIRRGDLIYLKGSRGMALETVAESLGAHLSRKTKRKNP